MLVLEQTVKFRGVALSSVSSQYTSAFTTIARALATKRVKELASVRRAC